MIIGLCQLSHINTQNCGFSTIRSVFAPGGIEMIGNTNAIVKIVIAIHVLRVDILPSFNTIPSMILSTSVKKDAKK